MKKNPPIFFICLLILYLINIDTVTSQIKTEKDSLRSYTFSELTEKFYGAKQDSLKAVFYAKYYIEKAKLKNDTIKLGYGNYYLSDITKDSTYLFNYWNNIIKKTKNSNNKLYPAISYLELGDFYFHKGKKEAALIKYLLMQKSIEANKNDSLKKINLSRLGAIKKGNKDYKEALILHMQSYNYYDINNINNKKINEYFSLLLNISTTHSSLKQYDSAIFYNKKMKSLALKFRDSILYGYVLVNYGGIELNKGNYKIAIDNFKKSIPRVIEDENYYTLSNLYVSLGKAYYKLDNINFSVNYYKKVDSLFQKTSNYYKSQKPAYKFLISYYKEKNNDKKQLEYINKYIEVDSVLNARAKNVARNLTYNYDIPNLLEERKHIENRLKGRLSSTKKWILGIASMTLILLLILIQQIKKRKLYKMRFQQLINSPTLGSETLQKEIPKNEQLFSKAIFQSISTHLDEFEKQQKFLSSEITLHSLAKTFETNSKYLSQFINQQKEQSFNNYLNRLRINFTIEKLKTDARFRKYSIKAIANEVGFNTPESFSKAFYKNTKIKPSYFIKELDKK